MNSRRFQPAGKRTNQPSQPQRGCPAPPGPSILLHFVSVGCHPRLVTVLPFGQSLGGTDIRFIMSANGRSCAAHPGIAEAWPPLPGQNGGSQRVATVSAFLTVGCCGREKPAVNHATIDGGYQLPRARSPGAEAGGKAFWAPMTKRAWRCSAFELEELRASRVRSGAAIPGRRLLSSKGC